jgi:hypothetical protein
MESSNFESRDSVSATCSLSFFDCLATPSSREEHRRASRHIGKIRIDAGSYFMLISAGVEREMQIMYQQPHLVPPMKLTVYEDLPPSPGFPPPSAMSQLVSQGRNLASRASERASLSIRKKSTRRHIGQPQLRQDTNVPRRALQRLELSIYLPENRLSDLPEFDHVTFANDGAIQLPPRVLLRAKSEEALPRVSPPLTLTRETSSMYEERATTMHSRQNIASSIISTSRPPSEYDALHSHPVSMTSMSGLPPRISQPTNSVSVLSPIQDEFTPPASSTMIDGVVMESPTIDSRIQERKETPHPLPKSVPAPAHLPQKFNLKSHSYSSSTSHSKSRSKSTSTSASQSQSRVAHWINHSQSSSISSSYSTLTTLTTASTSFSEHRMKKSQFYHCQPYLPNQSPVQKQQSQGHAHSFTPPKALPLHTRSRSRTLSSSTVGSTVETVDTNIMSLDCDRSDGESSATTEEAPIEQDVRLRSRARSYSKPIPLIKELDLPPAYARVNPAVRVNPAMRVNPAVRGNQAVREGNVLQELHGGLVTSPGVGIAF